MFADRYGFNGFGRAQLRGPPGFNPRRGCSLSSVAAQKRSLAPRNCRALANDPSSRDVHDEMGRYKCRFTRR